MARALVDPVLEEDALLVTIAHAPRHIFHFCPLIFPKSVALFARLNVSMTEDSAART